MSTYDLSRILPYVRESLRGRGNFNFDGFIDGLFQVLERAGAPSIEKALKIQGYSGSLPHFKEVLDILFMQSRT